MDKATQKTVQAYFDMAEEKLKTARILFDNQRYGDCVSRAYYAALHATKSLLLTEDVQVRSHEAARRMFGLYFVQPGKFPKDCAKALKNLQDDRESGDYEAFSVLDGDDAKTALEESEYFLAQAKQYLHKLGIDLSPSAG